MVFGLIWIQWVDWVPRPGVRRPVQRTAGYL